MKKKILLGVAAVAVLGTAAIILTRTSDSFRHSRLLEFKKSETAATEADEESAGEGRTRSVPAPASAAVRPDKDTVNQRKNQSEVLDMGPVFKPGAVAERRLEYQATLGYQISDLKTARAFFNQWIPRYGFLQNETASAHGNGYLTLTARVRSANLYAALAELDAIGTLANENITVIDHTENAVYQQMVAEREQIRLRRRTAAVSQNAATSRNWQAAETMLAASEDTQLQNKIAEWRVNDRVAWATITVQLSLPVVPKPAAVEVPLFQNAFVGVLNLLLQLLYLAIYLVPMAALIWLGWRAALKAMPLARNIMQRGA